MKNNINWREITDIAQLQQIRPQWQQLNQRQSEFQLFNSTAWIFSWLETFWQNHWYLNVLTAWHNDELVAIAPFYYQQGLTIKTLYPLGQGEAEAQEISSEYLDILIREDLQADALLKIQQWLEDLPVDQIIWRALTNKSHAKKILNKINAKISTNNATRYVTDCQSWSSALLSKNMRSRYRRGLNQLTKLDAKMAWVKAEDVDKYWQVMKAFHQKRWLNKDKAGAFSCDEFNLFHAKFRKHVPENIAMSAIWLNDSPIAIHYYFSDSSTLYFYQSGWNEEQYANLSPSLLLHLWSIENSGKAYYDFMMGKPQDSYKAKFSTLQQPMDNITITRNPTKLILSRILRKLTPSK
ncbi:MAG: GNAT family N-acetyltransferase [Cognaticolwellia sp.]